MTDPLDVVVCEPLRTPIGRFGGSFAQSTPAALAARLVSEVVARTGVDPDRIDEVILGHSYPTSEAPAIGRVAALDAGLPVTVTGTQVDRRCGSGLQAVLDAAMQIRTGFSEVVIAGGVDVMSAAPTTPTTDAGASRVPASSSTTPSRVAGPPPAASTTPSPAA